MQVTDIRGVLLIFLKDNCSQSIQGTHKRDTGCFRRRHKAIKRRHKALAEQIARLQPGQTFLLCLSTDLLDFLVVSYSP